MPSIDMTHSPLLMLPGGEFKDPELQRFPTDPEIELRNQIYEYAVPLDNIFLHYRPTEGPRTRYWATLRHLCRQTRAETEKLYESLVVSIPWHEIEAYVRVFFPSQDPMLMANYRGLLILDMDEYPKRAVDVLPLLKIRLYAPQVQLKLRALEPPYFETDGPYVEAMMALSGLTVTRSLPRIQDFAVPQEEIPDTQYKLRGEAQAFWYGQATTKVLVFRDVEVMIFDELLRIEMHVKEEFTLDGMNDPCLTEELTSTYSDIRSSLGLVDMWSSVVDMVVEGTTRESRTRYTGGTLSGW